MFVFQLAFQTNAEKANAIPNNATPDKKNAQTTLSTPEAIVAMSQSFRNSDLGIQMRQAAISQGLSGKELDNRLSYYSNMVGYIIVNEMKQKNISLDSELTPSAMAVCEKGVEQALCIRLAQSDKYVELFINDIKSGKADLSTSYMVGLLYRAFSDGTEQLSKPGEATKILKRHGVATNDVQTFLKSLPDIFANFISRKMKESGGLDAAFNAANERKNLDTISQMQENAEFTGRITKEKQDEWNDRRGGFA
ncbi:MAG: hypothetical protein WC263_03850 [Candidatus Micrarchaeia archaeon]|jgi:hypothetical protein